jgi:hypothetical protein
MWTMPSLETMSLGMNGPTPPPPPPPVPSAAADDGDGFGSSSIRWSLCGVASGPLETPRSLTQGFMREGAVPERAKRWKVVDTTFPTLKPKARF